mmetsp:Transcript_71147/g.206359  ORF Transcript_71147/g.206359 Transcript_71147/m.206359 type:complete len:207 (-) Transcript_71147:960-1580(-)
MHRAVGQEGLVHLSGAATRDVDVRGCNDLHVPREIASLHIVPCLSRAPRNVIELEAIKVASRTRLAFQSVYKLLQVGEALVLHKGHSEGRRPARRRWQRQALRPVHMTPEGPASVELTTSAEGEVDVPIHLRRVEADAHDELFEAVVRAFGRGASHLPPQGTEAADAPEQLLDVGEHAWDDPLHRVLPSVHHEDAKCNPLEAMLHQ